MKLQLLHFADLHLGVENYGRLDAATGLHSRLLDFLRVFDFIVETALSRPVDLVLFCGDAFRSREPSPTLQCLFAERIVRLAAAKIPVVILPGNHDLPPLPGRRSALEIYPILAVPGVEVVTRPGLLRRETANGPVQIACLPAGGESEKGTAALVKSLAAQVEGDCPAVLAGHVAISGARVGSETTLTLGREVLVPREDLIRPEFCYVALGHLHRFQDLNPGRTPPLVYCGSPERVDFSEATEPKGFVIVEIESSELALSAIEGSEVPSRKKTNPLTLNPQLSTTYEFVETPARRFVTVDLQLAEGEGTLEVLEAIAEQEIAEAVVKVVLRSEEEVPADEAEIRRALQGAAWATPIAREVERPAARLRAPELAKGWQDPLLALEEYLKTTRYSEERKTALRRAAEKLLGNQKT
jgi:DNA repair protein SbcD/Mre11